VINKLATVSMPRSTGTQTRTFTYFSNATGYPGAQLQAATNPESGTVSYYYNSGYNTLNYKIDAKGQKISYSYDSYSRVTQISKYPDGVHEDVCQRVNYNYDTDPDISTGPYNTYTSGRLTSIHYGGANCNAFSAMTSTATTGNNYIEMYAYTQAGQITNKRLRLWKESDYYTPYIFYNDLEGVYTYL
jgi:hypothetical protein